MLLTERQPLSIIPEILADAGLPVPRTITRLQGGIVNEVYLLEYRDEKHVLRFSDRDIDVYRKEKWVMQQAATAGVNVPAVQSVGIVGDFGYMVMEHVTGVTARQYKGDMPPVCSEVGRMARILNAIDVHGFGFDVDWSTPKPHFTKSWSEIAQAERKYIFAGNPLVDAHVLTREENNRAAAFLEPLLDWDHPPTLSHGDLTFGNVMIDAKGLVILIDWTQARGGPAPYYDLAAFSSRQPNHFLAFLKGYGLSRDSFECYREDVDRIFLINALRGTVWAREVGHSEWSNSVEKAQRTFATVFRPPTQLASAQDGLKLR